MHRRHALFPGAVPASTFPSLTSAAGPTPAHCGRTCRRTPVVLMPCRSSLHFTHLGTIAVHTPSALFSCAVLLPRATPRHTFSWVPRLASGWGSETMPGPVSLYSGTFMAAHFVLHTHTPPPHPTWDRTPSPLLPSTPVTAPHPAPHCLIFWVTSLSYLPPACPACLPHLGIHPQYRAHSTHFVLTSGRPHFILDTDSLLFHSDIHSSYLSFCTQCPHSQSCLWWCDGSWDSLI